MNRSLIVFLVLCTFAAAMVPRHRRAVDTEEDKILLQSQSTTTEEAKICAPQTPCAWSMYKPHIKIIEMNITNSYCSCANGTVCQITEDDPASTAYILRCRPPVEED